MLHHHDIMHSSSCSSHHALINHQQHVPPAPRIFSIVFFSFFPYYLLSFIIFSCGQVLTEAGFPAATGASGNEA